MTLMKMMIANTPAVVKYEITKEGIRVRKVVALNSATSNGKRFPGRRILSLSTETRYDIAKVIGEQITKIKSGSILR